MGVAIVTALHITPQHMEELHQDVLHLLQLCCQCDHTKQTDQQIFYHPSVTGQKTLEAALYTLYIHDCTSTHSSNAILRFSEAAIVLRLISGN